MEVEFEFGGVEIEIEVKGWRGALTLAGIALVVATVINELLKPPGKRTWHGRLFGVIPYDLRLPTPGRVGGRIWNPSDPQLLLPTAFGVGWTVNLAAPLAWGDRKK